MHIKQARNLTRRMRRALRGKDAYEHVVQLAYGVKGRMRHLIDAVRNDASGAVKPNANRPPKFLLPPLPGSEARETFTIKSLLEHASPSLAPSGESPRPSSPADVSDAAARQLAALRDLVPSVWERRARRATTTGEDGGEDEDERDGGFFFDDDDEFDDDDDDDDDDDAGSGSRASARGRGGKYRAGHFQGLAPWDVDRASPPGPRGSRPAQAFRGATGDAREWETSHVALVESTFLPAVARMMDDGRLGRAWRRFYGRALAAPREETLVVAGAPEAWKVKNGGGGEASATQLTLTHRGRVVDEMPVPARKREEG